MPTAAMTAIADATAQGELTPGEAFDLARLTDSFLRVFDARDEELRRKQRRAEAEVAAQAIPRPRQSFREWMDARFAEEEPREEVSG